MANLQEEKFRNQAEQIMHFHKLVSSLEKMNADLSNDLEEKEFIIQELKKKTNECSYVFNKYKTSVDELCECW